MPPATKESFARALDALVRKYEADHETYRSAQYNEAQTRSQFITPLLEALGWDVRNEEGVPYNLCEVFEEKGETHGRPDYTFRINGQTKFFLEAKKPSGGLHDEDILQTKRYAWNSRDIFFAAVCDFEDLYFFDASLRPDQKRPYDGEAFHIAYTEYSSSIDKLWELSRDRVAAGSLDQFLRKDRKSLSQKIPVDKDFLDNLTQWRQELASAIHAQNPQHDAHALNDIVQRLLDRIIFIRIAEDRKVIEPLELWKIAGIWEESGGRRNIMPQLIQLFQEFNERFNGEIFKPHPCEEITIESHALVKIIKQLYPPKSNYRFDVIGVELLGSIYERYLGNTLRITPKRVFIEPKPEVRKAGGVYYTPQYIVDYIVKNTVGKLVEGKTPKEVDKMRILDPACGSGSFLIGAFQFLIDWYLNYYREHPKEAKPGTIFAMTRTDEDGNLRLSFAAKSLILQHNLYGVDIDQQAVEVTMMSLYLKMLEGELGIQIPKQDKLPELKYNIRCGNSLIGPDIEKDKPLTPEERQRINPFDWRDQKNGFGDILKSGGFDAVIGNPPYIFTRSQGIDEIQKQYFYSRFRHQSSQLNTFGIFVERCHDLLRATGHLGFITPNNWLTIDTFAPLRHFLLEKTSDLKIVNILDRVFAGANVDTAITLFRTGEPTGVTVSEMVAKVEAFCQTVTVDSFQSPQFIIRISALKQSENENLLRKIETGSEHLSAFCTVSTGLKVYQTGKGKPRQTDKQKKGRVFHSTKKINKTYGRYLEGVDVCRYWLGWSGEYLSYGDWIAEPRRSVPFSGDRLLVRQIPSAPPHLVNGVFTSEEAFNDINSMVAFEPKKGVSLKYLLALINSRLLSFWFQRTFDKLQRRIFPQFKVKELAAFPIHSVDLSTPEGKARHDKIATLAERILQLNRTKHSNNSGQGQLARLKSEIADTDAEIDNLVYDLYGITAEERKIIEGTEG